MEQHSLTQKVFSSIKEDILSGKYEENEELREITIGKELGVSRTPVREALRQLELEGLVEIIPNKGAYVRGITAKDVQDIYLIRARLEGLCASMAAKAITKEQIERLQEVILLSEFYEQKEDYEHLVKMDSQFHEILYEACNSKMLRHLLTDYHHYVQRTRKSSLQKQKRAAKSTREHKEIFEAVKNRDAHLADELSTKHVLNTIHNIEEKETPDEQNKDDNPTG